MFERLWKDRRAVTAYEVVIIVVAFVVAAYMIPIGMTAITAANTTAWNAGVTAIFVIVLPIIVVIGIAIKFLKK